MRSFAECAPLFSLAWRSARQLGLPLPPSPSETRPFLLVAERIGHFAPRQQALLTLAFAQSWALRISFRGTWVWFVPAWPIPKGFAQTQKTASLAWEPSVLFHEERLLPAHASARQAQGYTVATGKILLA
ncbi:MAG: hypothetical protein DME51_05320 [Verrucomicrobia bacterium]|nr:MAG: hypothetical protein DME51_05320 [Verrucomicrobiota bacterium]